MKKRIFIILVIGIFSMISTQLNGWFDEAMFNSGSTSYSVMKPNILIMMDNSGSMNNLIYHPDYDQNFTYSGVAGDLINDNLPYKYEYEIVYLKKGTYYDPFILNYRYYPDSNFYLVRRGTTQPMYVATATTFDGVYEVTVGTKTIYLFAAPDGGNGVRISGNFLNFILYASTTDQYDEWNHFARYATWDTTVFTDIDGNWGEDRKVRMRVAREVMKNSVDEMFDEYDIDPNPDKTYPRFGISRFNSTEGGTVIQGCDANASRNSTKVLIEGIEGTTWTPLSEAYAEVYAYFRNGGEASITDDKYFLPHDNAGAQQIAASTPITNWCQLNFIIVVTDGEPTQDLQLRDLGEECIFHVPTDLTAPWGDIDVAGVNDDDTDTTLPSDGSNYLDDLAHYAFVNDLWVDDMEPIKNDSRFDSHMKNKQFIYTYTVGFAIDNVLLKDAAANGGGEYYTAKDYDSLAKALKDAFASIDEKVRAYAAFAAPKYSLTYGDRSGYVATFVPKATQSIWEGHLKSYKLDSEGFFPDLENPGSALEWDAAEKLNDRISPRVIYTMKSGNMVDFTTGLTAADLGFVSGDAAVDNDNMAKVIDFVKGDNGYGWKLGDIFHFTPTVVGAPLKWKASYDSAYQLFFDELTEWVTVGPDTVLVSKRPEVVYVGANDGMLHCFAVENGEELWAFIPPSLLTKLREMVPGVPNSDGTTTGTHQYFIDGKAIVKDIKVASAGQWTDWKTVLIFGYGIGGDSYCALDVTDPTSMKFLWEFNDPVYSARTEGKPIIARLQNDGTGSQFPGVILSGGYDMDEEPVTAPNLKGKSFFVLNAYSGDIIKRFVYDTSKTESKAGSTYTHTNPGFHYSFAATPSALDYDNDGLTDYIYMAESGDYTGTAGEGGRIWKVNVNGDPAGWDPVNIYQAPDGQTIWLPPTIGYDNNYNLWLFAGTGHRPQPNNSSNLTGQFVGIIDNSLSSTLSNTDLTDVNSMWTGSEPTITGGFWFEYTEGQGETILEPYPIFLNSTIYFNTYTPTTTSLKVVDPCAQEGNQTIYSFKVSAGNGQVTMGFASSKAGKIQGSGVLSGGKYNFYLGGSEIGDPNIQEQKTIDVESVFGSMTWEEKKR
ncbi:MAG: PilC/PilY family type IV pilus protein [Acidobacteriota bacterium]